MRVPTPEWTRPTLARVVTGRAVGPKLVLLHRPPAALELWNFFEALRRADSDQPTACRGWNVHQLVAHLTAGSREMAELLESVSVRDTREFWEREEPYRRMLDRDLRQAFVIEGLRLAHAIERRSTPVVFTGVVMTPAEIVVHARSELILHRWDITGGDAVDRRALADPAMTLHLIGCVLSMEPPVVPARYRDGGQTRTRPDWC